MSELTFSSMRELDDGKHHDGRWPCTTSLFDMVSLSAAAEQFERAEPRAPEEPDEVDRLFGVDPSD